MEDLVASWLFGAHTGGVADSSAREFPPLAIDIGTGASAIFPILGHRTAGLSFVATDIDLPSLECARAVIVRNQFEACVALLHARDAAAGGAGSGASAAGEVVVREPRADASEPDPRAYDGAHAAVDTASPAASLSASSSPRPIADNAFSRLPNASLLSAAVEAAERLWLQRLAPLTAPQAAAAATAAQSASSACSASSPPRIAFTVCNPPFFASWEEASRSMAAHERSACAGAPHEMATPGGEIAFAGRMLDESFTLQRRVLWYSCMFGRAASARAIAARLHAARVPTVRATELVQGTTRRWAVAWSFEPPSAFLARGWRVLCPWRLPAAGRGSSAAPLAAAAAVPPPPFFLGAGAAADAKTQTLHRAGERCCARACACSVALEGLLVSEERGGGGPHAAGAGESRLLAENSVRAGDPTPLESGSGGNGSAAPDLQHLTSSSSSTSGESDGAPLYGGGGGFPSDGRGRERAAEDERENAGRGSCEPAAPPRKRRRAGEAEGDASSALAFASDSVAWPSAAQASDGDGGAAHEAFSEGGAWPAPPPSLPPLSMGVGAARRGAAQLEPLAARRSGPSLGPYARVVRLRLSAPRVAAPCGTRALDAGDARLLCAPEPASGSARKQYRIACHPLDAAHLEAVASAPPPSAAPALASLHEALRRVAGALCEPFTAPAALDDERLVVAARAAAAPLVLLPYAAQRCAGAAAALQAADVRSAHSRAPAASAAAVDLASAASASAAPCASASSGVAARLAPGALALAAVYRGAAALSVAAAAGGPSAAAGASGELPAQLSPAPCFAFEVQVWATSGEGEGEHGEASTGSGAAGDFADLPSLRDDGCDLPPPPAAAAESSAAATTTEGLVLVVALLLAVDEECSGEPSAGLSGLAISSAETAANRERFARWVDRLEADVLRTSRRWRRRLALATAAAALSTPSMAPARSR